MGFNVGLPSLKLKNEGYNGENSGCFRKVVQEAIDRIGRDDDIDPSLSYLNVIRGIASTEELIEYSRKHIEEINKTRKSKIRSTAVVMCATIIKPPAAEMRKMTIEDQVRFMDAAIEEFSDIVGKENVKTVVIHFDELGPHTHIFWEPMTEDGRLCAKEVHNTKFFHKVNERIPKALRRKGFDVSDCNMYEKGDKKQEKAKGKAGRSSIEFKRDMEEKKAVLAVEIEEEEHKLAELQGKVLTTEEVAKYKEKPSFWGKKTVVVLSVEDFKNLRTTALAVDETKADSAELVATYAAKFENLRNAMDNAASREKAADEREIQASETIRDYEEKEAIFAKKQDTFEAEKASFEAWKAEQTEVITTAVDTAIAEAESAKKSILVNAEKSKEAIITEARKDGDRIVAYSERKASRIEERIESLEERKLQLESEVIPLEERAEKAHGLIDQAEREAKHIKEYAYDKGYTAGKNEAEKEYKDLMYEASNAKDQAVAEAEEEKKKIIDIAETRASTIRMNASVDAMRIKNDAGSDARIIKRQANNEADGIIKEAKDKAETIIYDAQKKAEEALEAKEFFDELTSAEGNAEYQMYRREPWFWLEMLKIQSIEMPQLRKEIEELKAILSFIPAFVVDRAKKFFDYFKHEKTDYESCVSLEPGSHHDADGMEERSYASRGRSR